MKIMNCPSDPGSRNYFPFESDSSYLFGYFGYDLQDETLDNYQSEFCRT